jgi:hypothetical protein
VTDSEQIEELKTGLLLYIPYRAMEARVFRALTAAGHNDFTPAQARVFQRIAPAAAGSPVESVPDTSHRRWRDAARGSVQIGRIRAIQSVRRRIASTS